MNRHLSSIVAVAASFAATSAFGEPLMSDFMSGKKLEKICVPASAGAGHEVDINKLVCEGLGQQRACKVAPEVARALRKTFVSTEGLRLSEMLGKRNQHLQAQRRPGCTVGAKIESQEIVYSQCVRVMCVGYSPPTQEKNEAKLPILIRETPDQFAVGFDDAKAASFAFDRNFQDGGNNFSLNGAIGYKLSGALETVGDKQYDLYAFTPYVSVNRVENTGPNGADVTNIAAGSVLSIGYQDPGFLNNTVNAISLDAKVVTDEEADSLIADANLVYNLVPPHQLFTLGVDLGPVVMRVDPSLRAEFGHVFDPGDKLELLTTSNYLRAGGSLGVVFRGGFHPDYNYLDGFSLSLGYTLLHSFDGPIDEFSRFEAALGYTFPGSNFGVGLKYVNGHVPVSLEEEESMRAEFLVKF